MGRAVIVLALNAGSSSLKFALFDIHDGEELELARGAVEGIGHERARLVVKGGFRSTPVESRIVCKDIHAAAHAALAAIEDAPLPHPERVGHRLVHGGPHHDVPARIDAALRRELDGVVRFSPLHLPRSLTLIDEVSARYGDIVQVACFDTTFHRALPEVARRFALPRAIHEAGIRRYGFHGLSYEYIVRTLGAKRLGRAVLAHLGSGSSLAAVHHGKSIDTTMGLTPAGGMMTGTRSGDLDPGVLVHLMEHLGYDARKLEDLVNGGSGLLAVSETTSDMKTLLDASERDARARLAVDMFCYSARKFIGGYAAALGGIDTLVFTGGIGERAPEVRTRICAGLEHVGIRIDEVLNGRGYESIGARDSRCRVLVVRTDEERMIARHTFALPK